MSGYDASSGYDGREDDGVPLLSWERLSHVALLLVVMIAVCRGTMLEILRDPLEVSPAQAYIPAGAGATTTVLMNLLCAVPAALVLLRRAVAREEARGLVSAWGPVVWVVTGGLATASTLWASDKYAALITGSTWLAAGGVCWATAQVVRTWGQFRLVTAVMAGLLLVYNAQGLYYHYVELPDTQAMVRQDEDKLLAERGMQKGTFAARAFIDKILRGEMTGFGASPNTYAAVLVMLGLVSIGLLVDGVRRKRDPVMLFFLVAGLAAAVWCAVYAKSRTSAATPVIAAMAIGAVALLKRVGVRSHVKLFAIGAGVCLLFGAAVVGHGLYHHSLPTDSMNFRWRYWTGAWAMVMERPWLGAGWSNFLTGYLPHRLPAASEEIRDPHNFLVRFATELGVVGLGAALVWVAVTWWEATRGVRREQLEEGEVPGETIRLGIGSLIVTVAGGMVLNSLCTVDFNAPWTYVVLELFKRLMYLGVLIVGSSLAYITSRSRAEADVSSSMWTLRLAGAAAAVFLVHNLVDFSLFENAPMFIFAVLLGSVIGMRGVWTARSVEQEGTLKRIGAGVGALLVVGVGAVYAVWPVTPLVAAEAKLREGDELLRTSRSGEGPVNHEKVAMSARAYREAYDLMPLNGAYASKAARAWGSAATNLEAIRELFDAAIKAEPLAIQPLLDRARLEQAVQPELRDLTRSERLMKRVTELNPTDVVLRLEYAALLERVGRVDEAAEEIRIALSYDDQLDAMEPKRLSSDQRKLAEERRKLLLSRAGTRPEG